MVRCAALGCTSGYDTNPEKVHFFHVPNNPDEAKLWQLASRRTDITLRKVHAFCEKHFLPGDIVYKITKCDATGKVIQEIPLRRPYRKAGAVPALFPWTEFPRANDENADGNAEEIEAVPDELTFEVLKCNDKIFLPPKWSRHVVGSETSKIYFQKLVCLNDERIIPEREITIDKDLQLSARALGKLIDITLINCSESKLKSLNTLEDCIKIFDNSIICKACDIVYQNIQTKVATKENDTKLRHNNCPIIIKDNSSKCQFCKTLPQIIKNKAKRAKNVKYHRLDDWSSTIYACKNGRGEAKLIDSRKERLDNFIKDISDVCHADHDYALPIASDCTTGRLTA